MNRLFIFLFCLFNISLYQCDTSSCRTNCTTDEECWHDTLTYRSEDLIEQIFSFSSLSVYVNTFQQHHSSEVNDTISFIDKALENHLTNELINTSLPIDLFTKTKQILIELCTNLTSVPIESTGQLPPLSCSLSTCSSDTMNFMVILIISILIASIIFLLCIFQSFQTYRQARPLQTIPRPVSFINSLTTSNPSVNFISNRF